MSTTDDFLLVKRSEEKKKQLKKDERTIGQVEVVKEQIDTLQDKEEEALQKIETSRTYFRDQIRLAEENLEKNLEKVRADHEKKVSYFKQQLEACDQREEKIQETFERRRSRKSGVIDRLASSVKTTNAKKLLGTVESEPEKSERQKALEYLAENPAGFHDCEKLFPNYYREVQEEYKKSIQGKKFSLAAQAAQAQKENEEAANQAEKEQALKRAKELFEAQNKALKAWKECRMKKNIDEEEDYHEVDRLKKLYDSAVTEYNAFQDQIQGRW